MMEMVNGKFPLTIIALIAGAVMILFSWLNQRTYRNRIREAKKLQEDYLQEARDLNNKSSLLTKEMVEELKAIRSLLEKKA
jgi:uncharacterized membrane protein